jgi:medium-chain acyl-[acyl-carrier-protein] hydrolase
LAELQRLNGTPRKVLENPELMQLLIPIVRADFELIQTYQYESKPPLDCSISAYGGWEDQDVTRDDLEGWRQHTNASFTLRMLLGDHFFLHSAEPLLLQLISAELLQIVSSLNER